jgi:hypothetical protein
MRSLGIVVFFLFLCCFNSQENENSHRKTEDSQHKSNVLHHHSPHGIIKNTTLAGIVSGCKFETTYEVSPTVKFQMCIGQADVDLKNGMTIINLIRSRAYLPTCRVLHLLLWMRSQSEPKSEINRELFIDVMNCA